MSNSSDASHPRSRLLCMGNDKFALAAEARLREACQFCNSDQRWSIREEIARTEERQRLLLEREARNSPKRKVDGSRRVELERRKSLVIALKNGPCTDCGGSFPYYVMEFDHLPGRGKKLFSISMAHSNDLRWGLLDEELAKCELVCSNCHRVRTVTRHRNK